MSLKEVSFRVSGPSLQYLFEGSPAMMARPALKPFVKWPGGKSAELPIIARSAPELDGRFIEPFVGGGSVLLAVPSEVPAEANDACPELVLLFRGLASQDAGLISALFGVADAWDYLSTGETYYSSLATAYREGTEATAVDHWASAFSEWASIGVSGAGPFAWDILARRLRKDLGSKLTRIRSVETRANKALTDRDLLANIEGAAKASFYLTLRERYNEARRRHDLGPWRLADFLFLREYAYAAMFRFNSRGEFNVPYGGVSYNRKSLRAKVEGALEPEMGQRLRATNWHLGDFEPFVEAVRPGDDDFVFVDPPYDSEFSDYDHRPFRFADQVRLEATLRSLTSRVMLIIKETEAIQSLYGGPHWRISQEPKTYMWTIKSRNDRSAVHLMITNY